MVSPSIYKRIIPVVITFVSAVVLFIEYFIVAPVGSTASYLRYFANVIFAFAIPLGAVTLLLFHSDHIRKRTPGQWYFSVWTVFMFVLFLVIGEVYGPTSPSYAIIYSNIYTPIVQAMWALSAFFITSASYRAFRAQNLEAVLLLVSAVLFLLGTSALTINSWDGFGIIKQWILNVPNTAGMRGLVIGLAIGAIVLGVRTLLGRERGYLGAGGS